MMLKELPYPSGDFFLSRRLAGGGLQPVRQTTNEISKNTKFTKIGFSLRLKNAFP
jgi:hypothetical protein